MTSSPDLLREETHLGPGPVRDRGRAVLLFPNEYRVGMASLAIHSLYALLNGSGILCERAFLPASRPLREVRSLESRTPLAGFDFILISSSFELDWLNIPAMLTAGGVPPLRADRRDVHPLVFIGGPAVTTNPEPLADLVDLAISGEIEPIADEFVATLREANTREEVLERLTGLPGVYAPGVQQACAAARLHAKDLNAFSTESAIVTPHAEFGARFLIEVGRGCGRGCRFCLARRIYHPNRVRRPEMLLSRVMRAIHHIPRVGLVGAAISDYPWLDELLSGLMDMGVSLSVSSVRAESVTDTLLRALAASTNETLTLAPEAGTERLRGMIGKELSDAQLQQVMQRGIAAGIRRYKLYFMVGLPGESHEDVMEIGALVGRLKRALPDGLLSVSVSPFVPKPHTEFAAHPMLPEAELSRRLAAVGAALRAQGIHEVGGDSPRAAAAQAVLGRGGRELGKALVTAALAGGTISALKSAVRQTGKSWEAYLEGDGDERG